MEAHVAHEAPTAVPIGVRNDHTDAILNNTAARPTAPTAASEVMVGRDPGTTLGEPLVPRLVPPMTDWEAMEAML